MTCEGGVAITMAEESLKAEKGIVSEIGEATAMTLAERFKQLQDKNIRLFKEVEEQDSTHTEMLVEIEGLDNAIMSLERELKQLESWRSESREKLEKAKREVTSVVSEGEISKRRKTTKGQACNEDASAKVETESTRDYC